jgi:hypothetical protein
MTHIVGRLSSAFGEGRQFRLFTEMGVARAICPLTSAVVVINPVFMRLSEALYK